MSEESKYLKLARSAREEGNGEDAKKFYDMVRTDDPENGEAKFFYQYYSLYEGKNGEIQKKYSNICNGLKSSVRMIKESDYDENEKISIIESILDAFIPTTYSLNRYMNNKNREKKVGDSYVTVFKGSTIKAVSVEGMTTLKDIGGYLISIWGSSPEIAKLAAKAWKEFVSLAQKWYAWVDKGEAETYASKIKEIDPNYEIPKKGGCIDFNPNKK